MIIEETEFYYALEVEDISDENGSAIAITMDHPNFNYDCVINMDKQQASQLIAVLQKWVDSEELE